jgi:hypothetical protein
LLSMLLRTATSLFSTASASHIVFNASHSSSVNQG